MKSIGSVSYSRRSGRLLSLLLITTIPIIALSGFLPSAGLVTNPGNPALSLGGVVTCQDVSSQTMENTPVSINVLSNCEYIVNGVQQVLSLHVESISQPSNGIASINQDNTVSYNPNQGYSGQDLFQFTASDPTGLLTGSATAHITVNPTTTTTTTTNTTQSTTSTTITSTTSSTTGTTSTASSTTTTSTVTSTSSSASGTSDLTVRTVENGGGAMTGFYTTLYQGNNVVGTGYTPAQFVINNNEKYSVQVDGYGSYYFQYWQTTGWANPNMTVTTSNSLTLTAVLCNGPPGTCTDPTPQNGITVFAHRIPASYWAPCFATACSAGTGPGATMYFELEDSSGNVIQTGYANEAGYTFTGLTPGQTYYVLADNCNLCHGSTHNVVFQYWGNDSSSANPIAATVGTNLDAWYSCTNVCSE